MRCRICGAESAMETSEPGGDAMCPACGSLLWRFRDLLGPAFEMDSPLEGDLGADSLDRVELLMSLEEHFGVAIPDRDVDRIRIVADFLRFLRNQ